MLLPHRTDVLKGPPVIMMSAFTMSNELFSPNTGALRTSIDNEGPDLRHMHDTFVIEPELSYDLFLVTFLGRF